MAFVLVVSGFSCFVEKIGFLSLRGFFLAILQKWPDTFTVERTYFPLADCPKFTMFVFSAKE